MNLKIFSIIVGILIAVIVILGGTYYYLFEYSKPKNYTLNTNTYTEQKSYTNNYDNPYSPSIQTNNSSSNVNTNNNTIQKQETNPLLDENQSLNNDTFNTSISENNQSLNNVYMYIARIKFKNFIEYKIKNLTDTTLLILTSIFFPF